MDILYLVGPNSINGYQDLRYSLRSIAQHGKNVDRVFVCGHCPKFLSDDVIKVEYIPYQALPKTKRIFSQVMHAVTNTDIGINNNGEFLISMDDHFYVRDVDFNEYPIYAKDYMNRSHRYLLPNFLDYTKSSPEYQQILINTYYFCLNNGLHVIDFVPHRNMHMNRNILFEMQERGLLDEYFNNPKEIEGLVVTQNYRLREYPFKFDICVDIKSNNPIYVDAHIRGNDMVHVFSSEDFELGSDIDVYLGKRFPCKCKYEK